MGGSTLGSGRFVQSASSSCVLLFAPTPPTIFILARFLFYLFIVKSVARALLMGFLGTSIFCNPLALKVT